MPVSLRSLAPNTKVNFTTAMQVGNRTVFNSYTFLGEVGYSIANNISGDAGALVAGTKAYFRPGASTDPTKITYVMVKLSESAQTIVIPEPLIDLNSVEVAGDMVRTITVRDSITEQTLSEILSGNGLKDFSIVSSQV
jgi:hypothetical protein